MTEQAMEAPDELVPLEDDTPDSSVLPEIIPPSPTGVSMVFTIPIPVLARIPKTTPYHMVRVFREEIAQAALNCLEFVYGKELFEDGEYPEPGSGRIKFIHRSDYALSIFKNGEPFFIEDERISQRIIYIMKHAAQRLLFQIKAPGAGLHPSNLRYNRITRAEPGILQRKRIWSIVRGQLAHSYNEHPDFFTRRGRRSLTSIAKRVTGDVWAYIERNAAAGLVYEEPTIEGLVLSRRLGDSR